MNLTFEPMTPAFAAEIATWRYPAPYERYGYADEDSNVTVEYMTQSEHRVFAVVKAGEMIAFRSFGEDGQVSGGNYDDDYLDTGGGLRPDLTGQGLGPGVIQQGLEFGRQRFGVGRFRVTIADFNIRAQRVCEKIGFRPVQHFCRESDGEPFTVLTIDRGLGINYGSAS